MTATRVPADGLDAFSDAAWRCLLRVLHEVLAEAEPHYWVRRARVLAAVGTVSADEAARACASRALVAEADRLNVPVVTLLEDNHNPVVRAWQEVGR